MFDEVQVTHPPFEPTQESGTRCRLGFASWLRNLGAPYTSLVYDTREKRSILADLQPYWTQIGSLTLPEASRYLAGSHDALRRQINFLGASLESTTLFLFAPVALFLALAYYSVHLRQLLFDLRTGSIKLNRSDWLALFPHWEAPSLSLFASCLLPVLAMAALTWRADTPLAPPEIFIYAGGFALTALLESLAV